MARPLARPSPTTSVAARVQDWIDNHPVVRHALAEGIVNHSALARRIQDDLDIAGHDAVLTACRRYEAGPAIDDLDSDVQAALRSCRMEIRTHVGLLAWRSDWALLQRIAGRIPDLEETHGKVHVFHGWDHVRFAADEEVLSELEKASAEEPLEVQRGLVELNLRSEDAGVPGFLAAITAALAGRGVNLLDVVSCMHDHVVLIHESELAVAVEAIDALRRSRK